MLRVLLTSSVLLLAVLFSGDSFRGEASAETAVALLQKALEIGQTEPEPSPVVHQRITAEDI